MALKASKPRRRGRPRKGEGPGKAEHAPVGGLDEGEDWGAQPRLESMQQLLRDLQRAWVDPEMPARDRASMGRLINRVLGDLQAERMRLNALAPDPLPEVDMEGLASEIVSLLGLLPRKALDQVVAQAIELKGKR